MLLPKSCSPCSPQIQHLFLGNCKWLLHLNFATIIDYYVFKRFITAIGLRALDLPYNILGGEERAKKGIQSGSACQKLRNYSSANLPNIKVQT